MRQDLSGSMQNAAELLTGCFDGIKVIICYSQVLFPKLSDMISLKKRVYLKMEPGWNYTS